MKKEVKMNYAPITREDVAWVSSAYSHLIELEEMVSGDEFARRIRAVYDCEASNKNNLAAYFAQYGISTIKRERKRNKVTWWPYNDVRLRSNAGVYDKWLKQEGAK